MLVSETAREPNPIAVVSEVRKHGLNSLDVTDKTQEEILDAALNILNLGEGGHVER